VKRNLITEKKTYLCRVVNDIEVEKSLWKIEFIDNANNILELITYNDNGEVIQYVERKFLDSKLVGLKEIDYENQIETLKSFKYQNDLLIQEHVQLENNSYYDTNYVYDKFDRVLSIIMIDESENVLSKEITTYEKTSQLVQFFDESDYIFRQEETEFDNDNRPIRKVSEESIINEKDEEELVKSIETYEYDAVGNEIKVVIERYDKVIYSKESKFNTFNDKTEMMIWSIETDFISKYEYEYDLKRNLIKEVLFEMEKLDTKFEYLYNHLNQLIKIDKTYLEIDDYYVTYRETIEYKVNPPHNS